jgi:molybdopterin-guanine dinucleotide biosynthesis protein A
MGTSTPVPLEVGGYVLAGGRSSRMGTDKVLLQLGGKPLIEHAVNKLRRVCVDVHILSGNPVLAPFGPLIPDLHPGCGPIGGVEAALAHSRYEWNLFLPVDVPFLPTAFLDHWVRGIVNRRAMRTRVALFSVFGVPQPTLLLIHRDAAPHIVRAVADGEFKMFPMLQKVAHALALPDALPQEQVPYMLPIDENLQFNGRQAFELGPAWQVLTNAQRAAQLLWFANLNTPEDFALAAARWDALDT